MRKLKLFEEFIAAEPAIEPGKTKTKPDVKPTIKPSRPSPLRVPRPNAEPTPKATAEDIVDRFGGELDNLSEEEKERYYSYLTKKYTK